MDHITILGLIAATLTTSSFIPQALKTWKTKRTKDLSLPMYIATTIGVFMWLVYGVLLNSLPLIIANTITLILVFCILVLKIKHG
jgi:MtN3 and saliva related transmembrane protein